MQPIEVDAGPRSRGARIMRRGDPLPAILAAVLAAAMPMPSHGIGPPSPEDGPAPRRPAPSAPTQISHETAWLQLLPEDERGHFSMIPPAPLHDYLSGDTAASQSGSAAVNAALEGTTVRLPGFIVPVSLTRDGRVSELLLVPYAGACIHVPPPPPNQMVDVRLDKALALTFLYDAYWVTGTLHTHAAGQPGAAAYTMTARRVDPYGS